MSERRYIPLSLLEKAFPEIGPFALAHLMSLGHVIPVGQWVGFSYQLKQVDVDKPTLELISAALGRATLLSDKVWVEMVVTEAHLESARLLLATDRRFVMAAGAPNSMLKP